MEFNILYGVGIPMIHWSPDGKKLSFSTFPKGYKGEDMWFNSGIGFYLLDEDKFFLLTAYDLLKIIGFYSVEDKCFKDYSYLKGNPDDPVDGSLCLSDYRCNGWLDDDNIFVSMRQPGTICGLSNWYGLITYNIYEKKQKIIFDFDNIKGASSLKDIKTYNEEIYLLILNQESNLSKYQDLYLIKISKEEKFLKKQN